MVTGFFLYLSLTNKNYKGTKVFPKPDFLFKVWVNFLERERLLRCGKTQ
jgi:hypothetical protein